MSIEVWLAFALASYVLLVIPGPSILTVISYSLSHGRKANLPMLAGVVLGDATALCLSLIGLGAILATSAWLFTLLKWIGGLYLIYLGIQMALSGKAQLEQVDVVSYESGRDMFFKIWLVSALNPKGIVFFVAFLPQFIDPQANLALQFSVLSLTFLALAALNTSLYLMFASAAKSFFASPTSLGRFKTGGGALLAFAGAWVLSTSRAAS